MILVSKARRGDIFTIKFFIKQYFILTHFFIPVDSFSNDGCDAGDTDADNLLVTVASSLFDLHDNTDIGNMEYFCVECGLSFSQLHELTAHRSRQHQPNSETPTNAKKPFQCDICKKHFNGVKILRRHMKIHSAIKPHACSDCNMSFVERSNLTKHQKKHTGELRNTVGKPNLCSVCGEFISFSFFYLNYTPNFILLMSDI